MDQIRYGTVVGQLIDQAAKNLGILGVTSFPSQSRLAETSKVPTQLTTSRAADHGELQPKPST